MSKAINTKSNKIVSTNGKMFLKYVVYDLFIVYILGLTQNRLTIPVHELHKL
jgi:hypothetical protein